MLYFFNIQTVIIHFRNHLYSKTIPCCIVLQFLISFTVLGQKDSIDLSYKTKKVLIHSSIAGTWAISEVALYPLWYKAYNTGDFHFFDDSKEWLHMDKVGHAYTNYQLTSGLYQLYRYNKFPKGKALALSTAVGLGFQSSLEIFDGFSEGWGFSWNDMLFNTAGCLFFSGQDYFFAKQIIHPKFSFFPTQLAQIRPQLLGSNIPEQVFKDYNGQTYWLSFSSSNVIPQFPKWLAFSFGYGIMNKIDASQNTYFHNGNTYRAYRQWYLSMDIQPNEIRCKRKWIKKSLLIFNYLKIPFPSIAYSRGKMHFYPFYF